MEPGGEAPSGEAPSGEDNGAGAPQSRSQSSSDVTLDAHTLSSADSTLNLETTPSTSHSGTTLDVSAPSSSPGSASRTPPSSGSGSASQTAGGSGSRYESSDVEVDSDFVSGSEEEVTIPPVSMTTIEVIEEEDESEALASSSPAQSQSSHSGTNDAVLNPRSTADFTIGTLEDTVEEGGGEGEGASPSSTPSSKSKESPLSTPSPQSTTSPQSTPSPQSTTSPQSTPSPQSVTSPTSTPSPTSLPSPTSTASGVSIPSPISSASPSSTDATADDAQLNAEGDPSRLLRYGEEKNELGSEDNQGGRSTSRASSTDYELLDPEGDKARSRHSLHAESINPTDDPVTPTRSGPSLASSHQTTSGEPSFASQSQSFDSASSGGNGGGGGVLADSAAAGDVGVWDNSAAAAGSAIGDQPRVQKATFPSSGLLFGLGIAIVFVVSGIVTGVTVYGRTPNMTDPLPVPTISPAPTPFGQTAVPTVLVPTTSPSIQPTLSPQVFFDLFETVVGSSVNEEGTSANLAANWMLMDDPAAYPLNFNSRSEAAWIQRYLLVYLYYSTTDNRQTEWLSCNPPPDELPLETECTFANPTEVPGGRVIYDFIPSRRWLSAAPDCSWAGVSCQTVSDDVSGGRLAVTSINLAGQNLIGSVVTELVELPNLVTLDLSYNDLAGTLFEGFRGLQTLRLQNNVLTGTIPINFFDNESVMQQLNIGSNAMNGTVPGEVGLASKLTGLYLFDNEFSGSIPVLGNMPLRFFQGYSNNFTGILPFDLFLGVWATTITEWWVYDNQLTGELSQTLGLFPNLRDFRVGQNQLTGTIPASTYTLARLFRLELNDNLLTGGVERSIRDLTSLETFDVSGNALNGTLPEEIAQIPVLRNVQVQANLISGTIPTDLCFLNTMEFLVADCLPEFDPPTECFCCTSCCARDTGVCVTY